MSLNFGNNLFPTRGEATIAFNYQDVIQAQSYIKEYLTSGYDNTATQIYGIIPTIISGTPAFTSTNVPRDQTEAKLGDIDFDILVNRQLIIKGKFMAELSISATATGSYYNTSGYCIVKLRKWDGTTETEIGSGKTLSVNGDNLANQSLRQELIIDITSNQIFKIGEYLRVTVEVWGSSNDESGGGGIQFYHDPENAFTVGDYQSLMNNPDIATDFTIHIPIRNNTI